MRTNENRDHEVIYNGDSVEDREADLEDDDEKGFGGAWIWWCKCDGIPDMQTFKK